MICLIRQLNLTIFNAFSFLTATEISSKLFSCSKQISLIIDNTNEIHYAISYSGYHSILVKVLQVLQIFSKEVGSKNHDTRSKKFKCKWI